jgi:SAM-dependent methyltransferase
MAELLEFYRRAEIYDIAMQRPVDHEVDFLVDATRRRLGREPRSALEIACGPGYHARDLASRGIRAVGLDLMPEMIEYARQQAQGDRLPVQWMAGDMRAFSLPAPVDLVFSLFDAIDSLLTNEEVTAHLQCVARVLQPGGLYIVQLTHPKHSKLGSYGKFSYSGERGGISVQIEWAVNEPIADPVTRIYDPVETHIRVRRNGHEELIVDRAKERYNTPQDVAALARCNGLFDVKGFYGDFDLATPFDARSVTAIAVFQKR